MTLCNDIDHDEVCYEGQNCPACKLVAEKKYLEDKIEGLEGTIHELKTEIDDLQSQIP